MHEVLLTQDARTSAPAYTALILPGDARPHHLLGLARASAPEDRRVDVHALMPGADGVVRVDEALAGNVSYSVSGQVSTVLRALHALQADALVLGYPDHARGRSHFTDVVERATAATPIDIVVCVERHDRPWRSILVPYLYAPLDGAALDLARRLARRSGASVTVLHVDEGEGAVEEERLMRQAAEGCVLRVVNARDPVEAAADEAKRGYDLVVLGAREPRRSRGRYFTLRQQRLLLATDASLVIVHPGAQAR